MQPHGARARSSSNNLQAQPLSSLEVCAQGASTVPSPVGGGEHSQAALHGCEPNIQTATSVPSLTRQPPARAISSNGPTATALPCHKSRCETSTATRRRAGAAKRPPTSRCSHMQQEGMYALTRRPPGRATNSNGPTATAPSVPHKQVWNQHSNTRAAELPPAGRRNNMQQQGAGALTRRPPGRATNSNGPTATALQLHTSRYGTGTATSRWVGAAKASTHRQVPPHATIACGRVRPSTRQPGRATNSSGPTATALQSHTSRCGTGTATPRWVGAAVLPPTSRYNHMQQQGAHAPTRGQPG
jgi:hypothetical protein